MALSADEKTLLRRAICDGAFNNLTPTPQGEVATVSVELFAAIDAMPLADVRTVIKQYRDSKVLSLMGKVNILNVQISSIQTNIKSTNDDLTSLQSITIQDS